MLGTSFSPRHALELGLDPKTTFAQIIDMGIQTIRLGAYWDEIQPTDKTFDFSELEWQLALCEKHAIRVVLCVGMKSPRWPEFYVPAWAENLETNVFESAVLLFVERTIAWAQKYSCIELWQAENEPLDPSGPTKKKISPKLLKQEIAVIRATDSLHRPVGVTVWGNEMRGRQTFQLAGELADRVGIDLYPKVFLARLFGKNRYAFFWLQRRMVEAEIRKAKKPVWIAELQAEPWEESAVGYRSPYPASMSPAQLLANWEWVQKLPVTGIFLWGCEYWLWRAQQGDQRYVKLVRSLVHQA